MRTVLRFGAVLVGLAVAGVALPSFAVGGEKCCSVVLDGVAGKVTVGGQPAAVTVDVARTSKGCTQVRHNLVVRLTGLDPNEVRVERVLAGAWLPLAVRSTGDGSVQASDAFARLCGVTSTDLAYRVRFLDGAPAGQATLAAQAFAVSGKLLGSDAAVTAVVAPGALPPAAKAPAGAPPKEAPEAQEAADGQAGKLADGQAEKPAEDPALEPVAPQPYATAAAEPPAPSRRTSALSRLSAAGIATGLGAVAAVAVALVSLLGVRLWRRRGEPTPDRGIEVAPIPALPGPTAGPTLPSRWPGMASDIRRGWAKKERP